MAAEQTTAIDIIDIEIKYNTVRSVLLVIFALLICNSARGFAGRLTRCLAFAATTVYCAFAKISCFESLNSFHHYLSPFRLKIFYSNIVSHLPLNVNC